MGIIKEVSRLRTTTFKKLIKPLAFQNPQVLSAASLEGVKGAEHLVLQGAKELNKQVDVIFTETSFRHLYKNSLLFNEMVELPSGHLKIMQLKNHSI